MSVTAPAPDPAAKAPKSAKLTPEQQAAAARTALVALHSNPLFDLQHEAWIPVLRDGAVTHVGLRELFTTAHLLTDLAVPQPLLRAGLRRFLEALTAEVIIRSPDLTSNDWRTSHANNVGFTADQVDALFDAHGDHLWLWHPTSPFLQDQRLADTATKPQDTLPITDMVLHLPSGSGKAWWVKAGEPALDGGLDPAGTALLLIARWFYAANGNCASVRLADGTLIGSQQGGAFADTVATVTHAFRTDPTSLYRTLVRGVPKALVTLDLASNMPAQLGSCAWLDLTQPHDSPSPLYRATLNAAAVLLTGRDDRSGAVTTWLRGSAPLDRENAKRLRDTTRDADPHRIVRVANGKSSVVRIAPGALRAEAVREFHRDALASARLSGVVASGDCFITPTRAQIAREQIELFLATKGGTGTSPVWDDLAAMTLPALTIDPDSPDWADVVAVVSVAFAPKTGVQAALETAIRDLLAQRSPDGWQHLKWDDRSFAGLRSKAVAVWLATIGDAFNAAMNDPRGPAAKDWPELAWRAARITFDQACEPYITSSRYAPRYATARRRLTSRKET